MTDVIKEKVEQVTEVLTKSMGAGKWIKDFVKSKNPKFAGKSEEKRKEMALGAFYSKEEVEQVVAEATNIKNVAGLKKVSSHGDFDLHKGKGDDHLLVHRETGEVHHAFSGKTLDVKKFLKNYEFENLPRPAKEEVSFDESNDFKQGFLDDYNVLRGHKNPEVKKHLTAAEINFKNENFQNAHSYMQKAKNAARTPKQANEEVSLDEGRGRPPKPGSAAYKRRQEDGGGEGDRKGLEAHLIDTQSHRTDHPPFHFADGEKVQLSRDHSNKAREHINAMKGPGKNPQARDNAIKAMSKSHAGFKQAIGVESKPEETKSPMSAQRDKPKLSLTKEESKMAQEDIVEKLQAALDAGILSQNDFDKLTQIDELSSDLLNRAKEKAYDNIAAARTSTQFKKVQDLRRQGQKFKDAANAKTQSEEVEAVDEKALSPKQKKIAVVAGDPGKIDAEDFKKLRKEETTAGVAAVAAALSRNLKELK